MMRKLMFVSTVVVVLAAVASPAWATKPYRNPPRTQDDVIIEGQCAFPVLTHIDGVEIVTLHTDADGVPLKQTQTFPGSRLTFTNMESGTSLNVMGTGATIIRAQAGGGLAVQITGHGPFPGHPLTGEPGIWYLTGRARATFDAEDNLTSAVITGRFVNLCDRLAG